MKSRKTLDSAFVGLRTSITVEEVDCERRGYKLTKTVLGAGAYAKVKLAYVMDSKIEKDRRLADDLQEKGHNMVAIKLVCKKKAPPEYLSKFMPREIDSLNATCRHRNVIQLYETFHTDTKIYLIMEYASRGDLLDYINGRSRRGVGIGEELAKSLFRQLAEGVAHCHRRNVVHRDLKCENILLDQDNIVKVSDFGFATRYPTNKCKLLSTFCGSYAYAAPEILQAQKYDGKCADLWSMGVILFAMVCGRLPFNDNSLHSLIVQTKGKLTFPPRTVCSPECQHMIRGILMWDPRKRFNMSEVLGHAWLLTDTNKALSVSGQTKLDSNRIVLSSIQKEIEQVLDEKKVVAVPEAPEALKQAERYTVTKTPVPKHGWSSSGNTPEPHTAAKLLHKRDYRLASKSPAVEPMRIDSPDRETPSTDTPRSKTPCPRSFTPTNQTKMPKKQQLAVKVAQIVAETGHKSRPSNLSRETFVIMNKALHESQRAAQARNDNRDNTQRVWKYVTNLSSSGRASTTPPVPDVSTSKDQASLPSVRVSINTLNPSPPTSEKPAKAAVPWRQMNLFSKEPVRNFNLETQQTNATATAQTHTTAGQDRRPPVDAEPRMTKTYKPYLMSLALQNRSSDKTRALRLPTSRESSERYPKAKSVDNRTGSGLNRFGPNKGRGRLHDSSPVRNSSLRSGVNKNSAPDGTGKKHVRFRDIRQT